MGLVGPMKEWEHKQPLHACLLVEIPGVNLVAMKRIEVTSKL